MSVDPTGAVPLPVVAQQRGGQGRLEAGVDLNLAGGSLRHSSGQGADPRQREGFGRAMLRAKGVTGAEDGADAVAGQGAVAPSVAAFAPPVPEDGPAAQTGAGTGGTKAVAERIDRYLRGAEGAASLRNGEGMVVRLPANVLGVSQVAMRMVGDVLELTLSVQQAVAAEAGARVQMGQLARDLAQRQARYGIRLLLDGETLAEEDAPRFNPLMPGGRG